MCFRDCLTGRNRHQALEDLFDALDSCFDDWSGLLGLVEDVKQMSSC